MKKIGTVFPYLTAGILCVLISLPIFSQSIYIDEAYSIEFVREGIASIVASTAADVHPPLYYLILKVAEVLFGENLAVYRLVSLLALYINLLAIGATYVRRRWNNTTAVFYILWFGAAYVTFERSVAIRMYSWATLFVTATAIFLLEYYEKEKMRDYVLGIIMTLAAMYTHYYAVFAVFVMWVMVLAAVLWCKRKRTGKVLLAGGIIAVGYLPWMSVVAAQTKSVKNDYWIQSLDWGAWLISPSEMMESALTGIGFVFFVLVVGMVLVAFVRKNWEALLSLVPFVGTMLMGALISVIIVPIWDTRYLYVAWGMMALFVGLVAGNFPRWSEQNETSQASDSWQKCLPVSNSWIPQAVLLLLLVAETFFSVTSMQEHDMMTCGADEWVAFLEENVEEDANVIYADPTEHVRIYRVYMPEAEFTNASELFYSDGQETLQNILKQSEEEQVWFMINYTQSALGNRVREAVNAEGYELESAGIYSIQAKNIEIFRIGRAAHEE